VSNVKLAANYFHIYIYIYIYIVIGNDASMQDEVLKTVSWKPETPPPKIITNKGILNYAAMEK